MNARSYLLCNMLYEGSPILRVSLVWLHFWLANPELVRKCEYPLFFPLALFAGDPLYGVGGQPKCLDCDFVDESFAEDG